MNTMEEDDVLEVNLSEIFYQLVQKLWIIILAGVVCAVPVFLFMEFIKTPVYTSTTSIMVGAQVTQLTEEYTALASGSEVMEQTLDDLQLDWNSEELKSKVAVSTVSGTRLLTISVSDQQPEMAKKIADTVREYADKKIRSAMGVENIQIVNEANIPQYSSGTSPVKATVVAGAAGIFIACCIIVLMTLFRSTISTPDEVARYTGLDTLGIIPLDSYEKSDKKSAVNKQRRVK